MFEPDQKVHFESDPSSALLTIKTVSPFIDMVELEEFEGAWVWTTGLKMSEIRPSFSDKKPDTSVQKQLDFLGI